MENKTVYAVCLKNVVIFLLPKHIKWVSDGVFVHEFAWKHRSLYVKRWV